MKRSWLILIGILVILAIATYFVLRQPGEVSSTGSSGRYLVSYDSIAVDKLELHSPGGTITLEKEAGKWMITAPVKYRADEAAVASAIGTGNKLEITSLVSTNPEKRKLFQVDSTGTLVRVYEKGAARTAFYVGKMGPAYTETYVRADGSNDVYLTQGFLSSTFGRQAKEWRDKTIFKTEQSSIKSVRLQYGDTTFTLVFQDSTWRIGKDAAVLSTVQNFLGAISNLLTDEFIDSSLAMTKPPTAMIEVEGTQLRFYPTKDSGKYYVQTSQSPQWFELQSWKAAQLLKRKKDFLPAGT
jgi:hypothetical protein